MRRCGAGDAARTTGSAAILPLPAEADPESACLPIAGEASIVRALAAVLGPASRVVIAVADPFVAAVSNLVTPVADVAGVAGVAGVEVIGLHPTVAWTHAVRLAVEHLDGHGFPSVLVHDWRHPLTPAEVTERVLVEVGAGSPVVVPVTAMTDSVKAVDADGAVVDTVDRTTLRNVQYPRGFGVAVLAELLAGDGDPVVAALTAGIPVTTVAGHADAGRFDLPADTALLEAIIATRR